MMCIRTKRGERTTQCQKGKDALNSGAFSTDFRPSFRVTLGPRGSASSPWSVPPPALAFPFYLIIVGQRLLENPFPTRKFMPKKNPKFYFSCVSYKYPKLSVCSAVSGFRTKIRTQGSQKMAPAVIITERVGTLRPLKNMVSNVTPFTLTLKIHD